MARQVKKVINNPFWYLGGRTGGRLCSHRKVGNMPKYQIMSDRFGGAVLDILPDDHKADTEHIFFDPTKDKDAMTQAREFAERYEAEHSQS
jgi:hypothetical protein